MRTVNNSGDFTPLSPGERQRLLVRGSVENAPISDINNRVEMNQSSDMPFTVAQQTLQQQDYL